MAYPTNGTSIYLVGRYNEPTYHLFVDWAREFCQEQINFRLEEMTSLEMVKEYNKREAKKAKQFKACFPFVKQPGSILEQVIWAIRGDANNAMPNLEIPGFE
jgi:hypothetical protein